MLFVAKNDFKGQEVYNLCFKRSNEFNNFVFTQNKFTHYINFLKKVYFNVKNSLDIEEEFLVKEGQKIVISSLNENYLKICSIKENKISNSRVFFVLSKEEIGEYLIALNAFYRERRIVEELNKTTTGFLRKIEKDKLYLNALYILINEALDSRNENMFKILSKEIKRFTN
nr:IDEAL domain-containing protein [Clostridium tetanomorphum]